MAAARPRRNDPSTQEATALFDGGGAQVRQYRPLKGKRRDPVGRPTDGAASWSRLLGQEPGRRYLWVSKTDQVSIANYISAGYRVERREDNGEGGVRPACGHTVQPGEIIELSEMMLMSVSQERHDEIVEYGANGVSGQVRADQLEDSLRTMKGNPLKGLRGREHMSVEYGPGHGHEAPGVF